MALLLAHVGVQISRTRYRLRIRGRSKGGQCACIDCDGTQFGLSVRLRRAGYRCQGSAGDRWRPLGVLENSAALLGWQAWYLMTRKFVDADWPRRLRGAHSPIIPSGTEDPRRPPAWAKEKENLLEKKQHSSSCSTSPYNRRPVPSHTPPAIQLRLF